jgi:hypothetical protein
MRVRKGKTPISLLLGVALSFSLLTAPATPSSALSFNSAPARIWGTLFASDLQSQERNEAFQTEGSETSTTGLDESQPRPAKSSFEITYVNIPDRAKAAIAKGVRAWQGYFESKVPIKVAAYWDRTAPFGVLGTARPGGYFNDFENAPDDELWYTAALANALAGKDLDPANPEIVIRISAFTFWYYGLDGKPGEKQFDLASVVLHEIGHGVGFLSNADYLEYNGFGAINQPTPFDAYAQLSDGRRLMDLPSPSIELGSAITAPLTWSGRKAIAANGGVEKPLLYTPKTFENGSSVSHLDEDSYPPGSINAAMTPSLADGEVLNSPGPLAEAMIQDMMEKPPMGPAFGLPSEPRNVTALVGDGRAIITFDPPANSRSAQVSSYTITNLESGEKIEAEKSPVTVTGLRNGRTYTFEIVALNENGKSPKVRSNLVTPERGWLASVIDPDADAKFVAAAKFQGRDVIAYTDSRRGDLKFASLINGRWVRTTVDGNSTRLGRTQNDVSGYLSLCTSGSANKERLHLFYTDLTNKDLRYGEFDGKSWKFEVVDGNGPKIQNYEEQVRVRTGSDVSVSNACAATSKGLQVFYRDESQGILLGAVRSRNQWFYEIVDGDKKTGGRTIGDVGFRLRSVTVNDTVYLIYDSILVVDQNRDATQGEVRVATRSTIYPEDWSYKNLETTGELVAVPGYDISIVAAKSKVFGSWLSSTPLTRPKPDRIKSRLISGVDATIAGFAADHGSISGPLAEDPTSALFGCQSRLCVMEKSTQDVRLIVDQEIAKNSLAVWIRIGKTRYALVGVDGKLTLFRP